MAKILTGTASKSEIEEIERWALEKKENFETLNTIKEIWEDKYPLHEQAVSEERIDSIWEKGFNSEKSSSFVSKSIVKYAAVILFIFGFYSIYYYFIVSDQYNKEEKRIEYTVHANPPGKKTKYKLPDGSVVFLNSSSSIEYVKTFNGEERKVHLKGEAYFEVAENIEKPFIVVSNGITTTALGTIFNINAYPGYEIVRVSLLEGKVEIQNPIDGGLPILLLPGKELHVNSKQNTYTEKSFNTASVVGWKEGRLVFIHSDFEKVKLSLERWFGVKILVKGNKPADWSVTTVYKNQSLKNILMDLQYARQFAYEINDDHVIIQF